MSAKNRVKQIDDLGRFVVPKDIRKKLDIAPGDEVEMTTEGDAMIIRKAVDRCVFCGSSEGLIRFRDRSLCRNCLQELKEI